MPDALLLGGLFVSFTVVIYVMMNFFSWSARVNRKIKRIESTPFLDYQDYEIARVIGQAKPIGELLTAPISGRPCVAYQVSVSRPCKQRNKGFCEIISEFEFGSFIIQLDEGFAVILDNEPKAALQKDRKVQSEIFQNATPQMKAFLNKHGYQSETLFGVNRALKYEEAIIEANEIIAAIGCATWRTLSDSNQKVLELQPNKVHEVYISDYPEVTQHKG
jgi:hypothetical protein